MQSPLDYYDKLSVLTCEIYFMLDLGLETVLKIIFSVHLSNFYNFVYLEALARRTFGCLQPMAYALRPLV